jgi:LuxR family maltose regulon positive regulatory protein
VPMPLLTTKLHAPQRRPNLVERTRLLAALDEGLNAGRRLTLVSAPAGFGKTTLIGAWVDGLDRGAAWLSLDEADSDPVQFLSYLVAALQQVDPTIGEAVEQAVRAPQLPPLQGLAAALINDVAAADAPLVLVLDDYQHIRSMLVHTLLEFLLANLPPTLHLAITTREDPPLPLPQMRARGQVTEIREHDLRFTPEEAAAFLNETMGLELTSGEVRALEARTEGWIAGLQLAALALQKDAEHADAFIAAFTGSNRYVMDYLVAEVLHRQPDPTRDFLQQTAVLDRLTAPLCDAVTGREDSQAILDQLEQANLFLIPLDHHREWYRYHRLFADVLRLTLPAGEQQELHQRAMRWFEANGYPEQAIQHALARAPGSGYEDAERLIRGAAPEMIHRGQVATIRTWLDALPGERVRADAELATLDAWVLALTGDMPGAEAAIAAAEAACDEAGDPGESRGALLTLRAFIALLIHYDYDEAVRLADAALDALPPDTPRWRVIALWTLAEAQERARPISEAIATLRRVTGMGDAQGEHVFPAMMESFLAAALNLNGQRREAIRVCERAIERYTDEAGAPSAIAGMSMARLATLHYEANDLDEARACAEEALTLLEQFPFESLHAYVLGVTASIYAAESDTDRAWDTLDRARHLATGETLGETGWLDALDAQFRLREGDLRAARNWADEEGFSPEVEPDYLRLEEHATYARLLLAEGRTADARRLLDRLADFTAAREMFRWSITFDALRALAAAQAGDGDVASDALWRAVELAAPEGYIRAFLDEDPRLLDLLPAVHEAAPPFVARLIEDARRSAPDRDTPRQPLVEPLTERELEVLDLIASGLSNREIGERLFITVGTVKRHINNMYGKLGVHSRTRAVAKARELGLLGLV